MSLVWMRHVACMNESYHTYEWIMSCVWTRHVTCMNESYHTYECIESHAWMSHLLIYEYVMLYECINLHVWMRRLCCRLCLWMSASLSVNVSGALCEYIYIYICIYIFIYIYMSRLCCICEWVRLGLWMLLGRRSLLQNIVYFIFGRRSLLQNIVYFRSVNVSGAYVNESSLLHLWMSRLYECVILHV